MPGRIRTLRAIRETDEPRLARPEEVQIRGEMRECESTCLVGDGCQTYVGCGARDRYQRATHRTIRQIVDDHARESRRAGHALWSGDVASCRLSRRRRAREEEAGEDQATPRGGNNLTCLTFSTSWLFLQGLTVATCVASGAIF